MSRAADIEELGLIGEKIVSGVLTRKGFECILSDNKYDQIKDITISKDGESKTVQVKTEFPLVYKKAFTIDADKSNQLPAALSADYLIFVEVPEKGYFDEIRVWLCYDRYYTTEKTVNRNVAVFRQSQMRLIDTVEGVPKLGAKLHRLCPTEPYYKDGHYRNDDGTRKRKSTKRVYRPTKKKV